MACSLDRSSTTWPCAASASIKTFWAICVPSTVNEPPTLLPTAALHQPAPQGGQHS
jgi:hypothetical protein